MKQEIIMLLLGSIITLVSGIATLFATNYINRYGKLKIYKKIVYSKISNKKTWGFYQSNEGIVFQIPLWIEIYNTTNSTQVVRNLNAWLYKDKDKLCSMTQINKINDDVIANDGAYSFVVEPRSIRKFDCHFSIKKKDVPNNGIFNEVKLTYYDANDTLRSYHLLKIDESDCWIEKTHEKDQDWSLLSTKQD